MSGSDDGLARVTYLPGVQPPSEPEREPEAEAEPEAVRRQSAPVAFVPDEASADELSADEQSARAANISMHALARRGVSSREMAALLTSRELGEAAVVREVERLEAVGLLDDAQLADTLVRTLRERKGLGRSAISAELRRRKLDDEVSSLALDAVDSDDELERATEIAVKRAGQLRSYDRATAERRLSGFLMRRGYGGSVVSAAVAAALGPKSSGLRSSSGPRFE